MNPPYHVKMLLQLIVDVFYGLWPQPIPSRERLDRCKIVSHRGVYDNRNTYENTLEAFDAARDHGTWGIELDIRWTEDLHPVVFHDTDTRRLFRTGRAIGKMAWSDLRETYPMVPSLGEVIDRYGGNLHLMVEIKEEAYPDPVHQNSTLKHLFSSLKPGTDFHLISLAPAMLEMIDFVPPGALLPIAEFNLRDLSDLAIRRDYRGITGHYLLLTDRYVRKHRRVGQAVGTGYIRSRNCLFRELNRGIDWVFTNYPAKLRSILDIARSQPA